MTNTLNLKRIPYNCKRDEPRKKTRELLIPFSIIIYYIDVARAKSEAYVNTLQRQSLGLQKTTFPPKKIDLE